MAMSLAGYRGRSRRPLTCSVCREIYRSPRLLPCFHSFCLDCLEGLTRHYSQFFPCPECRKPTAIPRNRALGFQMNFYIQEKDLERERNGPRTSLCPNHEEEPLLFFCVPCDQLICLCCKLTKHDHHEAQDLSEAAARCQNNLEASKDRVEVAINHLTKVSAKVHDNHEPVRQKESALIQEVCAKVQAIITRVKKSGDEVIGDIKQCTQSINSQLTQDAQNMQQKLDCLLQLRQHVNHALCGASEAEKVHMEKEMRQGEGSEEELSKVKECVPPTTVRPGLHYDDSLLNDDTLHQWLGSAVRLTLPFATAATPRTVFQVYQCDQDGSCREVHSMFYVTQDCIYISFGGTAPDYAEEKQVLINHRGRQHWSGIAAEGKVYFYKSLETDEIKYFSSEQKAKDGVVQYLGSKCGQQIFVTYNEADKCCRISYATDSFIPESNEVCFNVECEKPTAFDVSKDNQLFVIVEEKADEHSMKTHLNVLLFHDGESQPFTTYTPSDTHFHPADVCFWQDEGQVKLLVADTNNDSVHVVRIEDNHCCFERYMTAGSGHLVHPTALEADDQGHVWIGCSNGWVLRCEKLSEDGSSVDTDESDYEEFFCGSPLIVDNASHQTDETLSQMSSE